MTGSRVLVLIPHADDEVVGCATLIQRCQSKGTRFFGAYLTTGVPDRDLLWPWQRKRHGNMVAARKTESEKVAALLDIKIVLQANRPTRSLRLHLSQAREEIGNIVNQHAIDEIWVPAFEGAHQDHDAANCLAAQFQTLMPVMEFAEYNYVNAQVRTQQFPHPNGSETEIALTAAERARKQALLATYASERGNLAHIQAGREVIRPLSNYDYGEPPHAGTLFYARFQWVPFRHPRVDFTPPSTVHSDLAKFLLALT